MNLLALIDLHSLVQLCIACTPNGPVAPITATGVGAVAVAGTVIGALGSAATGPAPGSSPFNTSGSLDPNVDLPDGTQGHAGLDGHVTDVTADPTAVEPTPTTEIPHNLANPDAPAPD